MAYSRILIIQLRQLGDILLTTPCIRTVRQYYPQAELTVLTHKMGQLVLNGNTNIDRHLIYSDKTSFFDHSRLMRDLWRCRFDLVIDFMGNPRSAIFAILSRAPLRLGFDSTRRWAYTKTVPRPQDDRYIVDQKFDLLRVLAINPESMHLDLPLDQTAEPSCRSMAKKSPASAKF